MRSLIVDQNYQELGRFLDLPEIQWLHFDEIDTDIKKLSDDDIEDLEGGFIDYCGIIVGAYKAGWITDDQIATYGLEFAVGQSSGEEDVYEEFPQEKVRNMDALRRHIKQQWKTSVIHTSKRPIFSGSLSMQWISPPMY